MGGGVKGYGTNILMALTNYGGLQVHENGPRDMLPRPSLTEERVEGIIPSPYRLVGRHLSVRLDSVLQTVQLPACIAHLYSGLSDVDADDLPL